MNNTTSAAPSPYKMAAEPAFRGYIESTFDALLIFEACQRGVCPKVTRRLHERERRLIGSGSVYVFDERDTGIKRWTDGRVWSPSRILQNFLVYRELDKRATPPAAPPAASTSTDPPEQMQSATYAPGSSSSVGATGVPVPANHSPSEGRSPSLPSPELPTIDKSRERALVGSLTSSYRFRADGLVKKTISVAGLHMISYYKMDDVLQGRLRTPSSVPELQGLEISPNFLVNQNFRVAPQIEIGADGRPRYRGEGDGTQEAMPATAAYGMGYGHSVSPNHQPLAPLPPHDQSPHMPPDSLPQSSSSIGRSRPPYVRAPSSTDGQQRNMLGLSTRYDPYARPGSSSSSQYYSTAQPSPTYPSFGTMQEAAAAAAATAGGGGQRSMSGAERGGNMSASWGSAAGPGPGSHRSSYYEGSPPGSATEPRSFDAMQQQGMYHPSHRLQAPAGASDHQSYYAAHRSASVPPPPQSAAVYAHQTSSPRLMAEQQGRPESSYSAAAPSNAYGAGVARSGSTGPQSHYHYVPSPAMSAAPDPRYPGSTANLPHPSSLSGSGGPSYPQQPQHYGAPPSQTFGAYHPSSYATAATDSGQHQPQSFERGPPGSGSGSPLLSPVTQPQRLSGGMQGQRVPSGGMPAQLPPLARPGSVVGGSGSDASGHSSAAGSASSANGGPQPPAWSGATSHGHGGWMGSSFKREDQR